MEVLLATPVTNESVWRSYLSVPALSLTALQTIYYTVMSAGSDVYHSCVDMRKAPPVGDGDK